MIARLPRTPSRTATPLPLLAVAAVLWAAGCAHAPAPTARLAAPPTDLAPSSAPPTPSAGSDTSGTPAPAAGPGGEQGTGPIVFAAVGDVMLGTAFPDGARLPPDDGAELLTEVAPVFQAADVAFGNLEGPLLDQGTTDKCKGSQSGRCYAFRVPERYGEHLARAGFKVFSLANNHVGDFGEAGRARTRAVLDRLGIRYAGAIGEVAELTVRGTRVAVVAFSVSSGTNDLRDVDEAVRIVREVKGRADLVVVSFHGGAEGAKYQHVPPGAELFYGENRGDLRRFAHAVIDAGAGLVLGHGPHVVRGLEVYRGHLVAYSLGNFATYGGMNLAGPNGLTVVLEARIAPDGRFLGGRLHAGRQDPPGGPRWDPAGGIIPVVRQLSQEDFGAAAPGVADDGTLTPPGAGIALHVW